MRTTGEQVLKTVLDIYIFTLYISIISSINKTTDYGWKYELQPYAGDNTLEKPLFKLYTKQYATYIKLCDI